MARPWQTLETCETPDGVLELRRRGEDEFLITIAGRVLMNSHANRSELALAELACEAIEGQTPQRMLIGGLGMGCTLRAALDGLGPEAEVVVCELNPIIERWCREQLTAVHGHALDDSRVRVEIVDVAEAIARWADDRSAPRLDAIVLDLYEGPSKGSGVRSDPIFGNQALDAARRALAPGGVFAVWSEAPDPDFATRLKKLGFASELKRPGRGGLRHAVYLAKRNR